MAAMLYAPREIFTKSRVPEPARLVLRLYDGAQR